MAAVPLVFLLSGASSSGKTSLAKALQRRLPTPAVLLEADRTFPTLPVGHPAWAAAELPPGHVVLAFHRSLATWAAAGFDVVIIDGSLPYDDNVVRDACLDVFAGYDLRLIGVTCHVDVLRQRERDRPDERLVGWAERQAADIHDGLRYAAQVDTSNRTADECVDEVLDQLGLRTG